jgi:hypothetical protein
MNRNAGTTRRAKACRPAFLPVLALVAALFGAGGAAVAADLRATDDAPVSAKHLDGGSPNRPWWP